MSNTTTTQGTPPGPVGIPNVAQQNNLRVNKRAAALAGVGLLVFLGAAGAGFWKLQQYLDQQEEIKREQEAVKSAAAAGQARKFKSEVPPPAATPASTPPPDRKKHEVPDVDPNANDAIRVVGNGQRTGSGAPAQRKLDPRDAPMLLAPSKGRGAPAATYAGQSEPVPGTDMDSIRQQRQHLESVLSNLRQQQQAQQRMSGQAAPAGGFLRTAMPMGPQAGMPALPRMPQQQQQPQDETPTERAPLVAGQIADMSLTLAEGDGFACTLAVEVVSSVAGRIKCVTQQDVRGADQKVVLAEKGTILTGEYSVTNVRPGTRAIAAQWTRLRTPYGITVPLRWNAVGQLGASGISGHVNNRWGERITAALLLALIDDAVKVVIADKQDTGGGGNTNIVLGGTA
ncbi:TrbI/VirB10 family protein, partial [Azohydromonas australica]|uniref:TrbI/VirB10 family protein n=1 Tax=Azohydromonas australica TaxID=364039 RepID=UPI00048D53F0